MSGDLRQRFGMVSMSLRVWAVTSYIRQYQKKIQKQANLKIFRTPFRYENILSRDVSYLSNTVNVTKIHVKEIVT